MVLMLAETHTALLTYIEMNIVCPVFKAGCYNSTISTNHTKEIEHLFAAVCVQLLVSSGFERCGTGAKP